MTARDLNAARSVGRHDDNEAESPRPEILGQTVEGAEIELRLADLIGDERGEIVLFNDSSARSLCVLAEIPVVASGQTEDHRTTSGCDVSGFRFVRFANGLTIYFEEGLGLIVRNGDRAESF